MTEAITEKQISTESVAEMDAVTDAGIQLDDGRLIVSARTDVGCKRSHNEDNFLVDSALGLLLVADGMGGHDAGEVASAEVVRALPRFIHEKLDISEDQTWIVEEEEEEDATIPEMAPKAGADDEDEDEDEDATLDDLESPHVKITKEGAHRCNQIVHRMNVARGHQEGRGMGTTLVSAWFPCDGCGDRFIMGNVGDSRLYRFRGGDLVQLSRDHSMYQYWVDNGCQGERPKSNVIMQSIGPSAQVVPDAGTYYLQDGDLVLLCSDGLTDLVRDEEIVSIMEREQGGLGNMVESLVNLAIKYGGKDNVTVIVAGYYI